MEIAALGLRIDGVQNSDRAAASLDNLSRSGERAERATGEMGRTSGRSSREVRTLADESRRASSDLAGLGRRALSVASSLGLIVSASVAIRSSISTISSFEQSMARVQAISRATADEMRDLEAAARQLGATTEYSASQAADGLQFLSMAGFTAAESIAAIPDVLNLATAASLQLGQAADIASNVMSGFGIAADNASRVTDVLAASASRANTDVNQLGDAMSYVGPVASALGIDIGDTAAAIGVLSDAGIQGSSAGTGLRRVLSSLANPTRAAAKTLKELDVSLEDVNPQTNDLVDIIDTLAKAGIGASEALTIFGDRGGPALLALVENNPRLAELTAGLRDVEGEADRMAGTMRDNLSGDVKGMWSAIQELTLALNDSTGLGGGLRNATQRATEFFRAMSDGVSSGSFKALLSDIGDLGFSLDSLTSKSSRFSEGLDVLGEGLAEVWREARISLEIFGHNIDLIEAKMEKIRRGSRNPIIAFFGGGVDQAAIDRLKERRDLILSAQGDMEATISLSMSLSQELETISERMIELSGQRSLAAQREMDALTERQEEVINLLGRVNSGTTTQADAIAQLGGAVEGWRSPLQRVNDEITLMSESAERFRIVTAGSNDAVSGMVEELEAERRQLTMTSRELFEYNLITAMGEDANRTGARSIIDAALALYDQNEALKKTKEAAEEAAKEIRNLQSIIDRYDRSGARVRQLKKDHEALSRAIRQGLPGAKEAMDEYYDSLITVERRTTELAVATEESADWMATSFERGVERMRDGIGDFFERMIIDGKASFSDLTDLFKKMIAEMIATAAANRIMIGLGFAGAAGGASAGGLGGGGGGIGLSDILSMKNLVNVLDSGFASVGNVILQAGGLISRAGGHFAIAASNMGMGLVAAGDAIGGAIGMTNMSASAAAGLGGIATAGAGWAGGRIGSDLGLALTGKEGSGWGATGGAAIGAYVGSIVPVLGTMLGAAIGGLIGGVVDSIFGSSAWNTTRGGLQLGFGEDGFDPMQWERQTKKGGLFSSTKRRYRFNELDDELDAALAETYEATLDSVRELYGVLGVAVEDGVLEGVRIATLQIGTSGKSKQSQEAIEQQIGQWFADLQEAAVQAVDSSLNTEMLTLYASSLASVNEVFGAIGLSSYDVSIEGGKAAAQLLQLAGGIENLLTATDFYYQNFYSAHERMGLLTEQTAAALEAMGLALPESRQAFRDIVEGIDQTTEEGQALFLQLLNIAPAFADLTGRMGDLDREADELRIELLKLSGDMEGAAAASKALATDGMSALEIAAWERNQSLLQQIEEQRRAQEELTRAENDQIRAALEAADAAQKLAAEQERAAQQMARAQAQALSSIERSIGGLRERITLDMLGTPEAQYGYYQSQINAMGGMIGQMSSPEAISNLVGQMVSMAGSAYSLLDEEGRQGRGAEYLTFLDNLQHQSTQAIERAEKRKAEEQAKILKEAMAEAGKIMAETIKVAIEDGSLEIQQAGVVMTAATNAFASKVNELNRSREVNA